MDKSDIDYRKDYQQFTSKIRKTVRAAIKDSKVAVLHLDIQDFFNSIDHSHLTQVLCEQALPKSRLRLHYNDEQTKWTIREILFLIMQRSEGLPISQNNIISNLLSHLFLYPLDCCIREIQMEVGLSLPLTYHRYVDDMFITIKFPKIEDNQNIGTKMLDISTRIGEYLSSNLALSLNPLKTRLDIISSEDEVDSLIERSRLVSFYQPPPDEGGELPQNTLNRAILILKKLKTDYKEKGYVSRLATNDDLALKQCFQQAVSHYTKKIEVGKELEQVFKDWQPALIPKSIKVLIFLISRAPNALAVLITHVHDNLSSPHPSLTTLHLAENLMLIDQYQNEFDDIIVNLYKESPNSYTHLLSRLIRPDFPSKERYINIEDCELKSNSSMTYQIRRAFIAERRGFHSLAYNHLLNTLQEWCFIHEQSKKTRDQYDRNEIVKWLESFASHSEIVFVMTMFDRRNRNTISHPGDESIDISPVDRSEYESHLRQLNLLFPKILSRLPK